MKLIKVAAGVLNQTPLDWDANQRHIAGAIAAARAEDVTLLCLPELCICGYGCEDAFHSPGLQEQSIAVLQELAPLTTGMIVSVGLPLLVGGGLFNTACLLVDGKIAGFVGKQNLAGEGLHYEPRWFKRWPNDVASTVEIGGVDYPIGDLLFEVGGVCIGFEVCEDAWVASRPGADLALQGVDILLNPSASHFAFGKHEVRRRFVLEGSRAFSVSYIYSNLVGNEAGRAIYDGDAMIASGGNMLARGSRFSFADFALTTAVIDVDHTRMNRARTGSFEPRISQGSSRRVEVDFNFRPSEPQLHAIFPAAWEQSSTLKEEEFARAEALALFDYLRKSFSRGFIVSLSGGADSAAVTVLCALAVELGVSELGLSAFCEKLGHISGLASAGSDQRELVRRLLTTVYQATQNSSETTRSAAQVTAQAVGAEHYEFDVEEIVQAYQTRVADVLQRPLTWETDDIALQNIQARVRAPGVWMLANVKGALLLATSNRSEAAVGYATMDGDTCGGLSPIAGIDKNFLRQWLRWMQVQGPLGVGPLAALKAVNDQQPTAELRPQAAEQTDEGDLMPYHILDVIERLGIRDKLTPVEIFRSLRPRFPDVSPRQLGAWVERFARLWCRNQWKRERYAPSFHLDDENLDPKTWCRFPILSGGYEREIAELRQYLKEQHPEG
ncbi:NAD(+) synthase [Lignipirellula cremea]|uniref:Glutamine-dependent NAD(+) synthetase n=1 Tax=Lignipirellula cremea TaxID=2528010 RepID=A0A518DNV9_9BACT|nr:NAD(+) synthase [Lignipirellula cremea]QDU93524.1 Glutamine-dependent NAD(+) synthetase [Lignipirellula cremea]